MRSGGLRRLLSRTWEQICLLVFLPILFTGTSYADSLIPVVVPTTPALSGSLSVAEGEVFPAFLLVDDAASFANLEASEGDLPYELQGVRAFITIPAILVAGKELTIPQPLVRVRPTRQCLSYDSTCTQVLAVSVQIDWLQTIASDVYGYLWFTIGSRQSRRIELLPRFINPSILGRCGERFDTLACPYQPAVFHSDGRLVQANLPARSGEMLTVYLYGLGLTDPPVPVGKRAPSAPLARITSNVSLAIDYRVNAAPRFQAEKMAQVSGYESVRELIPDFIGLPPGSVGLYQINFVLPRPVTPVAQCASSEDSNVTITVSGADLPHVRLGFAGIRLCME